MFYTKLTLVIKQKPLLCVIHLKVNSMKTSLNKKIESHKVGNYLVKLRIDKRTVIMVRTAESLKAWKSKYPDAVEVL